MERKYNPKKIEKYVQSYWKNHKTFQVKEDKKKKKYYCLSMLPYPSGKLHMGHVRNYTIGDVISRYQRMIGKNVLNPIGWDAFGLPAENAAIKNNENPNTWTVKNIKYMKKQLKNLGFSYDWSREIKTCDPQYYVWEQWFFTKLFKMGLVYKKKTLVNWCSNDSTVLANEQVINNLCWRCGNPIYYKEISQWYIKITKYAEELLEDIKKLNYWPKKVKEMQKNWIGKTKGMEIKFKIFNTNKIIKAYTTQPEMIMEATYLSLSIIHLLAKKESKKNKKIENFIKKWKKNKINENTTNKINKEGIKTSLYAIHPFTKEKIQIWIVNFISPEHHSDAIISIPGINKYDFELANKYNLPIKKITEFKNNKKQTPINSNKFNYINKKLKNEKIINKLISQGYGKKKTKYKLRDWVISRQRFWGTPIPIIKIKNGKFLPVPKKYLPIIKNFKKETKININKPKKISINGKIGYLETDTFDTFIESSWYYARYTCPNHKTGMINKKAADYWLPIDQYIGGIEHANMHLLYFRFFHKIMRDVGLIKYNEPAKKLLCQGMVLSKTFYFINKEKQKIWIPYKEIIFKKDKKNTEKITDKNGNIVFYDGMKKMSKLKNNGIDPELMVKKYGADTVRLFIMFAAPPENTLEWSESGIKGSNRFIKKLWNIVLKHIKNKNKQKINYSNLNKKQKKIRYELYTTLDKVTNDISKKYKFNTAIAAIMKFIKKLNIFLKTNKKEYHISQECLEIIIRILYPFIPHICFVLWKKIGKKENIDFSTWPTIDKKSLIKNKKTIIIQINSKIKEKINIKKKTDKEKIIKMALKKEKIKQHIKEKKIKKIIYVPEKLLNFVIK